MEKGINNEHSCVDCGTQNCKYKIVHIQNSVLQQIWMKATGYGHWKNMMNPTIKP